jgi:hypothetical protein
MQRGPAHVTVALLVCHCRATRYPTYKTPFERQPHDVASLRVSASAISGAPSGACRSCPNLFCAANEPDVDSAAKTAVLLQYYQTFVNTVRDTGGNNTTRWLVLPGLSTNIDRTYDWMNSLPTDPTPGRLAVDVYYYDPFQFTLKVSFTRRRKFQAFARDKK